MRALSSDVEHYENAVIGVIQDPQLREHVKAVEHGANRFAGAVNKRIVDVLAKDGDPKEAYVPRFASCARPLGSNVRRGRQVAADCKECVYLTFFCIPACPSLSPTVSRS